LSQIKVEKHIFSKTSQEVLYPTGPVRYHRHVVAHDEEDQIMGRDARLDALNTRHSELEARLESESSRPLPDNSLIATLKRQKLAIKDEMNRMAHPS